MPHRRWRGGSVMHAMAIKTALSPDRMTLTPMICRAAIQNGACVMSCHRKSTVSSPTRSYFRSLRILADDILVGKELRDLDFRIVERIRAMHRVLADGFRVFLADRARRSL